MYFHFRSLQTACLKFSTFNFPIIYSIFRTLLNGEGNNANHMATIRLTTITPNNPPSKRDYHQTETTHTWPQNIAELPWTDLFMVTTQLCDCLPEYGQYEMKVSQAERVVCCHPAACLIFFSIEMTLVAVVNERHLYLCIFASWIHLVYGSPFQWRQNYSFCVMITITTSV